MTIRLAGAVAALLFLVACEGRPMGARAVPRWEAAAPSEPFPIDLPADWRGGKGFLVVPEDHAKPGGRTIRLPVAVVAATGAPDGPPVIMVPGGPGLGSLTPALYAGAYPWTAHRDFVVFAPRGTADADPALVCDDVGPAAVRGEDVAAISACREKLRRRGVTLSNYTTAQTAADIVSLAQVLDIDTFSLYGLSYGTRVSLAVARTAPDRVSAMVLDSPLPFSADFDRESADNFGAVLEAVAAACAADDTCAAAYPDLWSRFSAALDAAGDSAADLASIVPLDDHAAEAPYVMDAVARNDRAILDPLLDEEGGTSPYAWGVRLSIWCSERSDPAGATLGFAGIDGAVVSPAACDAWDVPARPDAERADPATDIPTLIIAGEWDAATPPKWGARLSETFSRSRMVMIPRAGHTTTTDWGGDGCAMSLAAAFLADPSGYLSAPGEPETCLGTVPPPDFYRPDTPD